MKKILLFLFCSIFAFAIEQDFLEPEEALKSSFVQSKDKLTFNLVLGKDIYLYDEKLKIIISKPEKIEITKELNIPKPVDYEIWKVHFNDLKIEIPFSLIKSKTQASNIEIEAQFQGCSKAGLCYAPMTDTHKIDFSSSATKKDATKKSIVAEETSQPLNETESIASLLKNESFIFVLGFFFVAGLALSLTPCIFPMIPILSSIIVKAGNEQEITPARGFFLSLVYVVSMALAYTLAGVVAGLFGANLQVALQNPYVLVTFSAIFVALAFSMFGYYKLELPQSLQAKIHKTTDGKEKQGVLGIAIMGFLSALIVGPCVAAPLAGALVYIGQTGDAILGGAALFIMSMGMGVPLLIIGLGAGKYMPKPGGWMDSVSKIFGIVMLAVAVWMLDRILPAIVTMYLWAILFMGTALYLQLFKHILVKLSTVVFMIYGVLLFIGAASGATNPLEPLSKFTSKVAVGQSVSTKLNWKYVKTNETKELSAEEKIAQLEAQVKEAEDKYFRVHADFENIKKRLEKEKYNAIDYASEKFAKDLLSPIDTLEMALAAEEAADLPAEELLTKLKEGVELTIKNFYTAFEKHDITIAETDGEFDPNFHNAIMQVDAEDKNSGEIVQVMQKGYMFKDRLLRPAMVSIAN